MTAPGLDTFIQEANELLEVIGHKVLAMESTADDPELINDIFRTAHTLKGNAGIFELSGIQKLTHTLESLLDALRHQEIAFTPAMIDVLLDGFDLVKEMVEVIADGGDHTQVAFAEIRETVQGMLPATDDDDDDDVEELEITRRTQQDWRQVVNSNSRDALDTTAGSIYGFMLNLDENIFNFGIDPLRMLDGALQLGEVICQEIDVSAVPPLDNLDPFNNYLKINACIRMGEDQQQEFLDYFEMVAELGEVWYFHTVSEQQVAVVGNEPVAITGIKITLGPVHDDFIESCEELIEMAPTLDSTIWHEQIKALCDTLQAMLSLTNPEARVYGHAEAMIHYLESLTAADSGINEADIDTVRRFVAAIRGQADTAVSVQRVVPEPATAQPAGSLTPLAMSETPVATTAETTNEPRTKGGQPRSSLDSAILQAAAVEEGRQCLLNMRRTIELYVDGVLDVDGFRKRVRRILRMLQLACRALHVNTDTLDQWVVKAVTLDEQSAHPLMPILAAVVASLEAENITLVPPQVSTDTLAAEDVERRKTDRRKGERRADGDAGRRKGASGRTEVFGKTIKIDQEHLDQLMEMVGEMGVAKNAIPYFERELVTRYKVPEAAAQLRERGDVIARIADNLQNLAMRMRMLPISHAFSRFPRLVRDTARKLGKKIELKMSGETVLLDKTMIESMVDPLIHMVRNSLDHGIEAPEGRTAAHKPERGTVNLDAWQEGNTVCIRIRDDGRGIDPDAMRVIGVKKELATPEEVAAMSDEEAQYLIFRPGFSSIEKVTDLSGRGVGMDVVARAIADVKGEVRMSSTLGVGTEITLRLPLSLAITKVLVINQDGQIYGLPAQDVVETISLPVRQVRYSGGRPVIALRGNVLPLLGLNAHFQETETHFDTQSEQDLRIAVIQTTHSKAGLIVDHIERDMDIMIKPLSGVLGDLAHIAGGAILGDGRLLFVLNTQALLAGGGS